MSEHPGHLKQKGGFPDTRFSAHKCGGTGDNTPTEDPVELSDPGRNPVDGLGIDLVQGQGLGTVSRVSPGPIDRRPVFILGRGLVRFERIPSPTIRAFAVPLGVNGTTLVAQKLLTGFWHGRVLLIQKVFQQSGAVFGEKAFRMILHTFQGPGLVSDPHDFVLIGPSGDEKILIQGPFSYYQ